MAISQAITSSFKKEVLQGVHNLDTDTFKLALYTNSANLSSATIVYISDNEVSGTGYTAGGTTLTNLGVSLSGTIAYADWNPATWSNATFSNVAAGLIYNASKGNKTVAVLNFGGEYAVTSQDFTVTFPDNNSLTAPIIFN